MSVCFYQELQVDCTTVMG